MPDSRPSKRAKKIHDRVAALLDVPPEQTLRNCSTSKPLHSQAICGFRVTVCIGVPKESNDGKDIWIMQVQDGEHTGHCPHNCEVQGKPLRIKVSQEVDLAVQVVLL